MDNLVIRFNQVSWTRFAILLACSLGILFHISLSSAGEKSSTQSTLFLAPFLLQIPQLLAASVYILIKKFFKKPVRFIFLSIIFSFAGLIYLWKNIHLGWGFILTTFMGMFLPTLITIGFWERFKRFFTHKDLVTTTSVLYLGLVLILSIPTTVLILALSIS